MCLLVLVSLSTECNRLLLLRTEVAIIADVLDITERHQQMGNRSEDELKKLFDRCENCDGYIKRLL